jgi:hypothetical protein
MDTEMASEIPQSERPAPASEAAALALAGLATNLTEVLAAGITRRVRQDIAAVPAST